MSKETQFNYQADFGKIHEDPHVSKFNWLHVDFFH